MNIAIGSIFIIIILLPGIIFRSSYLSSEFSRKVFDKKPLDDLFWAILPSIVIHYLGLLTVNNFISKFTEKEIKIDFLFSLVKDKSINDFTPISSNLENIFLYNITLLLISFLLGHLFRIIIRYFKLDRKYAIFRFSNKWHYIFTGEILDFPNIPDSQTDVTFILIDVLCDLNSSLHLISGQYLAHNFDNKGEIKNIILKFPMRKKLDSKDDFFVIESKFFLIPYSTIKNLNIRYINIENNAEEKEEETDNHEE